MTLPFQARPQTPENPPERAGSETPPPTPQTPPTAAQWPYGYPYSGGSAEGFYIGPPMVSQQPPTDPANTALAAALKVMTDAWGTLATQPRQAPSAEGEELRKMLYESNETNKRLAQQLQDERDSHREERLQGQIVGLQTQIQGLSSQLSNLQSGSYSRLADELAGVAAIAERMGLQHIDKITTYDLLNQAIKGALDHIPVPMQRAKPPHETMLAERRQKADQRIIEAQQQAVEGLSGLVSRADAALNKRP